MLAGRSDVSASGTSDVRALSNVTPAAAAVSGAVNRSVGPTSARRYRG